MNLTIEQIKTILTGSAATLKMVQSSELYQKIQASEEFTTSNDLTLADAIQAINEVYEGILDVEDLEEIE